LLQIITHFAFTTLRTRTSSLKEYLLLSVLDRETEGCSVSTKAAAMEPAQELPTPTAYASISRKISKKFQIILPLLFACSSLQHSWKTLRTLKLNLPKVDPEFTEELEELSELFEQQPSNTTAPEIINSPEVKLPPQSMEDSFSACLMLMDNNHRVAEWVAYHYYALPLRTLVVYVDPYSRDHPKEVLEKWEPYIDITYWDKVTDIGLSEKHLNSTMNRQSKKIVRQTTFLGACAWDLRQRNRTWTMFVDVDEYLHFDHKKLPDQVPLVKKPGFVSELIKEAEKEGSMAEEWRSKLNNRTCLMVPRVMYSAYESEKDEVLSAEVPDYLDPYRFNTARFRHYSDLWSKKNNLGKSLLRVDLWDAGRRRKKLGVHRLTGECPGGFVNFRVHPLRINHYLGSWETYSFIDDPRIRDKTDARNKWEYMSQMSPHPKRSGNDDMIRSWISDFANWQGEEVTRYLLSDIGTAFNSSTALFKGDPYTLE